MPGASRRRWTFRPGLAPTLATAVLLPVLLALGQWQLARAAEKAAIETQATARRQLPPLRLDAHAPWPEAGALAGRRVLVRGRWLPGPQVLLDNQVLHGRAGYRVFTPLRVDGGAILVDRGWTALGPDRGVPPDVHVEAREVEVSGLAARPPVAGWHAVPAPDRSLGAGLLRVQALDPPALARDTGLPLLPWTLRLDPTAPDGYRREWPTPGFGADRHRAYAVQWFALAAVLVALYVGLNLRRGTSAGPAQE